MRIHLQDTKTGLYLQSRDVWVKEIGMAFDFMHSQRAVDYARAHNVADAQVIAAFSEGGYLHSIPFPIKPLRQPRTAPDSNPPPPPVG